MKQANPIDTVNKVLTMINKIFIVGNKVQKLKKENAKQKTKEIKDF